MTKDSYSKAKKFLARQHFLDMIKASILLSIFIQ